MPFSIDFLDDGRVLEWEATADGAVATERDDYTPRFYVTARDPASDLDLTTLQSVYDQHPDVVATELVSRRPGFRRDEETVLAVDVAHIDRVTPLARQARQLSAYPVGDLACFNVDVSREFRYCLENGVDPTPASELSTLRLSVPVTETSNDIHEELSVAVFVGLNLRGVTETGLFEDIAVYIKIVILLSLAALGVAFYDGSVTAVDFFSEGVVSPITGFAIIFVSYEGFQLLVCDYEYIDDVERTLPIGMYLAIAIAMLIYVSVSFMATLHLTPEQLVAHEEVALAEAVSNIPVLGGAGFLLVILSAMKSTSSGINTTLFGTAGLVHKIATEGALPLVFSFWNREGIPVYSVVLMGGLTATLAAFGTLKQITEFGSVAFLISFAVTKYTSLWLADETGSNRLIPTFGLVGTAAAIPIVLYHLYRTDIGILLRIVGIFVGAFVLKLTYIERHPFNTDAHGEG